ncbi:helix-turn-helix domain-containing protein [Bacteroides fragilis]|uniref:helix-turn-helix domain-containing protein n=1 Tax=Bacteroides fragilis TaxID=817 RepID=UPI001C6FDFEE|nr:helix-turn-helix domain-containing protein [Bacteroides fragilis]MBW9279229.1 helix-turn-helix domain-containing protein [Bacteroides fragilis]
MNEKISFDTLPAAVMELVEKVDYIINLLGAKVEKREEIPKYLNTENALAYLKNIGFSMSKSKLYKLTALKSIPVHKNGNNLLFLQKELEQWFESQIHTDNDKIESITNSCLYGGIKNNRKNGRK